jgi:hypothetical protein
VHALHSPGPGLLDVIARNSWTPSIGTGGRHQSVLLVAITRYAHAREKYKHAAIGDVLIDDWEKYRQKLTVNEEKTRMSRC